MKKLLLSLLVIFCFNLTMTDAQTAAPDFTVTDINGTTHTLYDYLEDGKYVILDVSATWCGPCWGFHQAHILEYLHQVFGPEGTNEMVVLFLEGDPNTNMDDLMGTGGNTIGDWIAGTSYPIINETTVSNEFLDTYAPIGFPTINVICPDTKTIIGDLFDTNYNYSACIDMISGCGPLSEASEFFTISDVAKTTSCDTDYDLEIDVYNIGTQTETAFTVQATDAQSNILGSVDFDGDIAIGEKMNFNLGTFTSAEENGMITYEILNLMSDNNLDNNSTGVEFGPAVESVKEIKVYIESGGWVQDDPTEWNIVDENGEVVIEGPALVNNSTYEETHEVPGEGCYVFVMTDGYGDGIDGVVSITDAEGTVIFDNAGFGSRSETKFNVAELVSSTQDILEKDFSVSPTIVEDDQLMLTLPIVDYTAGSSLTITDSKGQVLKTFDNTDLRAVQNIDLDVSGFAAGVYFATLKTKKSILTRRFITL